MLSKSRVSVGSEAACSLLRMVRNGKNKNINQSCHPTAATAKRFMCNISVKHRFIYTKAHARNGEARLSSGKIRWKEGG